MWSEITRLLLEVWPQARHSQIDLPRVGLKIFIIWSNTPTIQNKIDILKLKLLFSEAFSLMVTQCFSVNWWPVAVLAIDCFMLRMFANHVALSSCQIRTGIRTQLANKTRVSLGQEIHYVGPMLTYKNKRHNDINSEHGPQEIKIAHTFHQLEISKLRLLLFWWHVWKLLVLQTSSQVSFQSLFMPAGLVAILAMHNIVLSMFPDHVALGRWVIDCLVPAELASVISAPTPYTTARSLHHVDHHIWHLPT